MHYLFKIQLALLFTTSSLLLSCDNSKRKDLTELNESFGIPPIMDQDNTKSSQKGNPPNTIELITYDLDNDGLQDSVLLKDKPEGVEPGEFRTIQIILSSGYESQQKTSIPWDFIQDELKGSFKNQVESKRVIILSDKFGKLLITNCYKLDCCPRNISILRIHQNKVSVILNRSFDIAFLGDYDYDGIIDLCGRNAIVKHYDYIPNINADIGTYVPFQFFNLTDRAKFREDLTKKYNLDNYIFQGIQTDEQIKVVYPREGKPYLYEEG